jgi:PAS domain S-box-containing protein
MALVARENGGFVVTSLSAGFQNAFGVSASEAVGKPLCELLLKNGSVPSCEARLSQAYHSGTVQRFTLESNKERWDVFVSLVSDQRGSNECLLFRACAITQAPTAEKETEDPLKEDRPRWRDLLMQAPAAVALTRGPEHRFEWLNSSALALTGYSDAKELIGKTVSESLPAVIATGYSTMLDQVFQSGVSFRLSDARMPLPDDEQGNPRERFLNFVCMPTLDAKGEIDGTFVHATDVTDQVVSRKRLEESERQFRTLSNTIPHLAWIADERGYKSWFNKRWYEYTGTTPEEVVGWGWKKVYDPAFLGQVTQRWERAIATGEPSGLILPLRGVNGKYRLFLTLVEPVNDDRGRVVRWFGTHTDITEQEETAENLRRANRELEEFAHVASHDLQEPLRMIGIYTQLLLKKAVGDSPELQKYGRFIQQGVNRMETLINDVLTFSRTVHAEEKEATQTDLNTCLKEAIQLLERAIADSGAQIRSGPLPAVCGEQTQLTQVFQNVLSNAIKYRKTEVAPSIHVEASQRDEMWVIAMKDNGVGFEPEYSERIFGLFKRLYRDEYPGTGLGLAICRRIVERFGGKMWAEGQPGVGSTFYFSLKP